jgi:glycosyltransferase involved in cell wall biosynthesis/peptidoglycan/xylan/chitin deacetylase (PgdA/CDA1 family)
MFHRILPKGEDCYTPELATSTELFHPFLDRISENYEVISLEEFVKFIRGGVNSTGAKRPPCAITFDDGWRDFLVHAFPALRQRQFPATVFLPVQFIGTNRRFWQERLWYFFRQRDRRQGLGAELAGVAHSFPWCPLLSTGEYQFDSVRRLLMSRPSHEAEEFVDLLEETTGGFAIPAEPVFLGWDEVKALQQQGITFGSHTLSHQRLTHADPETARLEIHRSRLELEERLGAPVAGFSYPWGSATRLIRDQVKEAGYEFAVTTREALAVGSIDPWLLPRIPISSSVLRAGDGKFQLKQAKLYLASRFLRPLKRIKMSNGRPRQERLRVAFVIDRLEQSEGGTEQQLCKLLQAVDRRYFEPELCLFYRPVGFELEGFPCPVYLTSCPPVGYWSRIRASLELFQFLRRRRPQIVQTFFTDATVWGTLMAWMARVPVIINSRRNCGSFWQQDWKHRLALKVINRLANSWQCNARVIYEFLTTNEGVAGERIEILPNAVDLSDFSLPTTEERLTARQQLGLFPTAPVFVAVAHLRPVKDVPAILAAATRVKRELADAQFLVVGDGPLKASLQMQIEQLGLAGTVRLEGKQLDVRPYLAAADIGLLTSRSEGSPNALLEYMAMGLPAVVSDIPANRELVDEVVFEAGNATDLADKLLSLWDNREQRSYLRREYRRQAEQYGLETFVQRAQSYYVKLAARHF